MGKIDYNRLVELMGGDNRLADRLIQSFKSDAGHNLKLMLSYLESSQFDLLSNTAHVLKTQSGYLGLDELRILCEKIEHECCSAPSTERLNLHMNELSSMIQAVLDAEGPYDN